MAISRIRIKSKNKTNSTIYHGATEKQAKVKPEAKTKAKPFSRESATADRFNPNKRGSQNRQNKVIGNWQLAESKAKTKPTAQSTTEPQRHGATEKKQTNKKTKARTTVKAKTTAKSK